MQVATVAKPPKRPCSDAKWTYAGAAALWSAADEDDDAIDLRRAYDGLLATASHDMLRLVSSLCRTGLH